MKKWSTIDVYTIGATVLLVAGFMACGCSSADLALAKPLEEVKADADGGTTNETGEETSEEETGMGVDVAAPADACSNIHHACIGNACLVGGIDYGAVTVTNCAPDGIPGNMFTYSSDLAQAMAKTVSPLPARYEGFASCGSGGGVEDSFYRNDVDPVQKSGACIVWTFAGPNTGRAHTNPDNCQCPDVSDPIPLTWN